MMSKPAQVIVKFLFELCDLVKEVSGLTEIPVEGGG